jgi:hypothetical protein
MNRQVELLLKLEEIERAKLGRDEKQAQLRKIEQEIQDEELVRRYRVRKSRSGSGVVAILDNVCLGCGMHYPDTHQVIQKMETEVVWCEFCGRIVYPAPPELKARLLAEARKPYIPPPRPAPTAPPAPPAPPSRPAPPAPTVAPPRAIPTTPPGARVPGPEAVKHEERPGKHPKKKVSATKKSPAKKAPTKKRAAKAPRSRPPRKKIVGAAPRKRAGKGTLKGTVKRSGRVSAKRSGRASSSAAKPRASAKAAKGAAKPLVRSMRSSKAKKRAPRR